MKPRVFIHFDGVVRAGFDPATDRQRARRLGYEPVWQEIFGTEPGDLRQMLRSKIDDCVGLVQIVGRGFGAEPPQADAEFGRVSYTQYELLYARKRGNKTWVVFAKYGGVHDRPLELLDLPSEPDHSDPAGYQADALAAATPWLAAAVPGRSSLACGGEQYSASAEKLERLKVTSSPRCGVDSDSGNP